MIRTFQGNELRCRRLIERAIRTFDLNLSTRQVLTEAATGYYALTPLIAALAGAEKVYALTADSHYGLASDIKKTTMELAARWGVDNRIEILTARDDERIGRADIVTNLGFVRPLDKELLKRLRPGAVIPLMWETWEYRPEDLDLEECRRLQIPVLGTNEHHSNLLIFDYVGQLAVKLLLEAGIEVLRSRVVVIGSGEFAAQAVAALKRSGADVTLVDVTEGSALSAPAAGVALREADAAVIIEHHQRRLLIGAGGDLSVEALGQLNEALTLVHICGGVDADGLRNAGFGCVPKRFAPAGFMSVATDYVGPRPIIDLHTAGLKVGQEMAVTRPLHDEALQVELDVLKRTSLAHGFSGHHTP